MAWEKDMIRDNSSTYDTKIIITAKARRREMINNDVSVQDKEKQEAGDAKDQGKNIRIVLQAGIMLDVKGYSKDKKNNLAKKKQREIFRSGLEEMSLVWRTLDISTLINQVAELM